MGPHTCWGKVLFLWLAVVANLGRWSICLLSTQLVLIVFYTTPSTFPVMKQKQDLLNLSGLHYCPTLVPIPYWENQGLWNPSKCWISSAHIPDLYHNLSIIPRPLQPEVFDHLQVINNWRRWRLKNKTTVFHSVAVQTSWTIFPQPLLCVGGTWDILQIWSICTPLSEWVAISTSSLQFFNFSILWWSRWCQHI